MAITDWLAARAATMLDPTVTNLNTGSFGPTPRAVFDRVTQLRQMQAAGPMNFLVRQSPPLLWHARQSLANFVGVSPERIVFTQNVTTAINIVAAGLRLSPGEILMSDREYGAMAWCWERAAERQGLSIRRFHLPLTPRSADELVDAVAGALTESTRLVFLSHVYSANGMFMPVRPIAELIRRHGAISVIDGAHAPGLLPLEIDSLACDFYAGNCHKWLLAPIGAGFLTVSEGMRDRLEPLQVSWGYRPDGEPDRPDEFGSTPRVRRLEFEGTRDICPWLTVPDAISLQSNLGWPAIWERQRELAATVRQEFEELELQTPTSFGLSGPMTAFRIKTSVPSDTIRQRLWDRRVEIPVTDWPDQTLIRVSTHFYTTEEEITRGIVAVRHALGSLS